MGYISSISQCNTHITLPYLFRMYLMNNSYHVHNYSYLVLTNFIGNTYIGDNLYSKKYYAYKALLRSFTCSALTLLFRVHFMTTIRQSNSDDYQYGILSFDLLTLLALGMQGSINQFNDLQLIGK